MNNDVDPLVTAEILKKIEGRKMPHVPDAERTFAVERAVRILQIGSHLDVDILVDVIDTNEEQLAVVHAEPSDPT